jgi:hypothetical protein
MTRAIAGVRQLITVLIRVEGFHRWPDAPAGFLHLQHRHRHLFEIRIWKRVFHENRDIEIIDFATKLRQTIAKEYGDPAEFGDRSCEAIAGDLLILTSAQKVQVLEDGEHGALLERL